MQNQNGAAWAGQQSVQTATGGQDEIKTLWIGDLQYWMDESYLWNCFVHTGEVLSVKVIRNKQTGYSEGYGFVELNSRGAAERILQTFNGSQMPQTEQAFRINWASFGAGEKRDGAADYSIFVGDLASDVTDVMLNETFRSRYPSVKGSKVVIDNITGRSKGYGFVRFGDENERDRAMAEMNGEYCSSRPMRISVATPKKQVPGSTVTTRGTTPTNTQGAAIDNDPTNTTVFVGGLDPSVSDEDLRQIFSQYGELVYVKIPYGKGCGFVQFQTRQSAEDALQHINGTMIGTQVVRLSWGRNPATKTTRTPTQAGWTQPDPTTAWTQQQAYYSYAQPYDYTYATPQDPNAYAAYGGYSAYGAYPSQQAIMPQVSTQQMPMQHQVAPQAQQPAQPQQNLQPGGSERQHDDMTYDPMAPPDIDRMNAAYAASNEQTMMGPQIWMKGPDNSIIA